MYMQVCIVVCVCVCLYTFNVRMNMYVCAALLQQVFFEKVALEREVEALKVGTAQIATSDEDSRVVRVFRFIRVGMDSWTSRVGSVCLCGRMYACLQHRYCLQQELTSTEMSQSVFDSPPSSGEIPLGQVYALSKCGVNVL
jgi:hypothetical protein